MCHRIQGETSIAKLVPGCAQFSLFLARLQSSKYQISENFIKRFGFCQFSSFLVNFGCFLVKKRPKKAEIQKKFFQSIFCLLRSIYIQNLQHFFCWEVSIYQISENFIKRFGFCRFSSFLVNFGYFLVKKRPKKAKSKKSFFVAFFLLGSIYIPNFRKFHQTAWILPVFLIFGQFWLFFWLKNGQKKAEIQKKNCSILFC